MKSLHAKFFSTIILLAALCPSSMAGDVFYFASAKNGLTLRIGPAKESKKIASIPYSSKVKIISRGGPAAKIDGITAGWFNVRYGEHSGWVFSGYLSDKKIKFDPGAETSDTVFSEEQARPSPIVDLYTKKISDGLSGNKNTKAACGLILKHVDQKGVVEYLACGAYKNSTVIWASVDMAGDGNCHLLSVKSPDGPLNWKKTIPAFNTRKPVTRNNFIYLCGIGFIGKINLDTGNYAWKRDDLYHGKENLRFNNFSNIFLYGDHVIFIEGEKPGASPRRKIIVNDAGGKIESIEEL
jgi:hypothetical protein